MKQTDSISFVLTMFDTERDCGAEFAGKYNHTIYGAISSHTLVCCLWQTLGAMNKSTN